MSPLLSRSLAKISLTGALVLAASFAVPDTQALATPTVGVKIVTNGQTYVATGYPSASLTENSIGNWTAVVDTGTSSNPSAYPTLNMTVSAGSTAKPKTALIYVTEYNIPAPSTEVTLTSQNTYIFNNVSSATFTSYYDTTDTPYGKGTQITTNSATGPGTFTGPTVTVGPDNITGQYSITLIYDITSTSKGTSQALAGSVSVDQVVPEPSAMAVFGLGLVGLAAVRKRGTTRIQRA